MDPIDVIPELKQIVGALLYASRTPITLGDIRKTLKLVAETGTGAVKDFGEVGEADVRAALEQLQRDLHAGCVGVQVVEVANGFRMQNDVSCGLWVRQLLNKARDNRLSKPALETLAIIAYRQPITRAEIESVRGVQVDQVMRTLLDLQLIRIVGRKDLPGRPWLFGTTQKFLEFFGLKNVQDLPGIEELRRVEADREKAAAEAAAAESATPVAPAREQTDGVEPPVEEGAEEEAGDADIAEEEVEESEADEDEFDEDEDEFDDDDEGEDEYDDDEDDEDDDDEKE